MEILGDLSGLDNPPEQSPNRQIRPDASLSDILSGIDITEPAASDDSASVGRILTVNDFTAAMLAAGRIPKVD